VRSGGVQRGAEKAAELIDHAVLEMAATIDILGRIGITVDPFPNEPEDQRATRVLAYTSRSPLPLATTPDRKRSTTRPRITPYGNSKNVPAVARGSRTTPRETPISLTARIYSARKRTRTSTPFGTRS
jgi:hypothetical protein